MKKLLTFLLVIAVCALLIITLTGCVSQKTTDLFGGLIGEIPDADDGNIGTDDGIERVGADELYSDNGYVDYAKDVYFDVEKYPELADQGLFWCYFDEVNQKIVQVAADTKEGAALVDPSKPTLITIHGMMADGGYNQEDYSLNAVLGFGGEENFAENGANYVNMNEMWIRKGWNVANFQYNRFGAESISPTYIEEKVWSVDGDIGMRYRKADNSLVKNCSEYCLAEHFCAEYLRAMALLPDTMGSKEIRFMAHSMGGTVLAAGGFLLTEMVDCGRLSEKLLPDRLSMLDTYYSVYIANDKTVVDFSPKGITINWSGKNLVDNQSGLTIISALEVLVSKGAAIEYYTYKESFLQASMNPTVKERLKAICVLTYMAPDYDSYSYYGGIYNPTTDAHNAVRTWYMTSLYYNPVVDSEGNIAASASTPTDTLRALVGSEYLIKTGSTTLRSDDDVFTKVR